MCGVFSSSESSKCGSTNGLNQLYSYSLYPCCLSGDKCRIMIFQGDFLDVLKGGGQIKRAFGVCCVTKAALKIPQTKQPTQTALLLCLLSSRCTRK